MEFQKVPSATSSKKLKNSYSFSGKSIYDGVFGGTAKVASRVVEDYGEIFGGSGGPSIPVLDVPELNEGKVSVDVSSTKVDYSKIFGGFEDAVSDEELAAAKSNKRDSFVQEARTPVETDSHTSNASVKNQVFAPATSYQSLDGKKQFKMSYNKINQGGQSGTNGKTHIARLHVIPAYTCLIDEAASSWMTEGDKPLPSVSNGSYHNINFSGEIMQGIPSRKAVSTHLPGAASKQASGHGIKFKNKSNSGRSKSTDMSSDAFAIGIGSQPSKVPPPSTQPHSLTNNKGDLKIPVASKFGFSKSHSSEEASGVCSPPYFDEQVDVNSVAAASAAAVKKAIEEAQARIRIAKEIMERMKDGRNHVKLRFKNDSKVEREEGKIADKVNKFRDEACEKYGKADKPMSVAALGSQNLNAVKADQVAPDFKERDNLFLAKRASCGMHAHENKTTPVDHKWAEAKDRKSEKQGDIEAKLARSVNEYELEVQSFTEKRLEKPEENGEKLELVEEAHKQEEMERKLNVVEGACEMKEFADKSNSYQEVHDQEENEQESTVAGMSEEIEVMFTASHKIESSGKKLRSVEEPTTNEKKLEMLELEDNEYMKMRIRTDEQELLENEQEQKEVFKQEHDMSSEDVLERDESEVALKEIFYHKERGERDEAACVRVELENQQKEACTTEESEVGQIDVRGRNDMEETSDTEEQEKIHGRQGEKKLDEDGELGVKEKLTGAEENVHTLEEAYKMIETEKRRKESPERAQAEKVQEGTDHRAENEKDKITQEALQHWENNLEAAFDVCKDKNEILSETLEVSGHEEDNVYQEKFINEENEEPMEVTRASSEWKEMETESNAVELANELEEEEVSEVKMASFSQVILDLNDIKKQDQDTTEALSFDYDRVNLGTTDMTVTQKQDDLNGMESGIAGNADKHVEELTCESEIFEDAEEVEVAVKLEEDESNLELSGEEKLFDNRKNMEATQPPIMFQGKEETTEISQKLKTSQNTEKHEENYGKTPKKEEREVAGSLQKEVELEKEHLQKREKTKETEKEREKERIAVERAIREARERAFAEARERAEKAAAEKANAEARQRAVAEAQERSEKTYAETNGKSSVDKIYMEARLKAERAAVQRATAEARERALEKAMSEKASLGTRNHAVKSSGASRETGMRQNFASSDSQHRGSGPTRSMGNPNSSNNSVNGESIHKDKASLERDKQTAERAAKALAEKNMRDLLAQKEQAERNRLAEALDADVKRWSSGKTGNLRALLSTLQYILGPDCGWQPIPLTDLLTSTAVKKTYRKATLFVHPDKLQQRGASIQQKYICEKVFDLLKEAWNKFNGEER